MEISRIKDIKAQYGKGIIKKLGDNFSGIAVGYKFVGGKRTDEVCLQVFVKKKLPVEKLPYGAKMPDHIEEVKTDVIEATFEAVSYRTEKHRPAPPGVSIGHYLITAGTFGFVHTIFGTKYILSNNHVLANCNTANIGDNILQQGVADGGVNPDDKIATLYDFETILFALQGGGGNLIDAAIALPDNPADILEEIYEVDKIPSGSVIAELGQTAKKSGRTTGVTTGTVTSIDWEGLVHYGIGLDAYFVDQFTVSGTGVVAPGDSGSAVFIEAGAEIKLIGLLFAASGNNWYIANQISNVLTRFNGLPTPASVGLSLRPNAAGDETNITFQSPGSGEHWDKVNEATPDADTTVVYTPSLTYQRDLYNLENTSQTGIINWIKVWIRCAGWGGTYVRTAIKTGGVVYEGIENATGGGWNYVDYSTQYILNPQTGLAWTWTQINALQAGVVLKGGDDAAACTQVYVEVESGYIGFHTVSAQRRYKVATFSTFTFPDPAGTGFTVATDGYSMLAGWGILGAFQMFLSGTLHATGSLGRKINKSLSGSLASSGTVSYFFRFYKVLYGTLNLSGTLIGLRKMVLGGVLNLSGTLNRLIKKSLSGTLNSVGGLVSRRFKVLAGTLDFSGALTGLARFSKALAGMLNLSGSLTKLVKKNLAGVLNSSGTLGRKIWHKLSGTLNFSGFLGYGMPLYHKVLEGTLNLSGSLGRKIRKSLSGTVSFIGTLTKFFATFFVHRYVIEIHDPTTGALIAVLKNAYGIELVETINAPTTLSFRSPADEAKLAYVTRANEIWVRDVKNNVVLVKTKLLRDDDMR